MEINKVEVEVEVNPFYKGLVKSKFVCDTCSVLRDAPHTFHSFIHLSTFKGTSLKKIQQVMFGKYTYMLLLSNITSATSLYFKLQILPSY